MRVTREQFAENRQRILKESGALFRAKGFDGIGIADIMKAVGLTHGGFYGHFASKDELAEQSVTAVMEATIEGWRSFVQSHPDAPLEALVDSYLSMKHVESPGAGCMLAAAGGDAARQGTGVRAAFASGLNALVGVLVDLMPGRTREARRRKALADMASMVGAIVLARAVNDAALAQEILDATSHAVLAGKE